MSYNHLTISERIRIEIFYSLGYSSREIARHLNRHHSTISREIKRGKSCGLYTAESAQSLYERRRSNCTYFGKITLDIDKIIIEKLLQKWSPEQIASTVLKGVVSFKTIYNWIYANKLDKITPLNLRHKGKRRKKETRGRFIVGRNIKERPSEVKDRKTFGHWELDTIVSSRGKSKACMATFAERMSRFYVAVPIKDRTAVSMEKAIKKFISGLPEKAVKSFTTDRGKEFACYAGVEKELKKEVYFADPYAPWQRGTNENSNGLLREYYPKKTDLGKVKTDDLIRNLMELNFRPRKCLNWETPFAVFLKELKCCT